MFTLLIIMALVCAASHVFVAVRHRNEIETINAIHLVKMTDLASRAYRNGQKLGSHPTKNVTTIPSMRTST